jgi:hypothetical protein
MVYAGLQLRKQRQRGSGTAGEPGSYHKALFDKTRTDAATGTVMGHKLWCMVAAQFGSYHKSLLRGRRSTQQQAELRCKVCSTRPCCVAVSNRLYVWLCC